MTKWLERAKCEILKSYGQGTAVTAERTLTAVLAVRPTKENEISGLQDIGGAEVETILAVWRRTVGLALDRDRVQAHLGNLKQWESKLRKEHR